MSNLLDDQIESLGIDPNTTGAFHTPTTSTSRRSTSKIYSVSFQGNGFTCQETTAMAANSKCNFMFNESETTPVFKTTRDNPLLEHDDHYNEMIVDCDDTDKILNYGDETMSKSLDSARSRGVNYNSIGSPKTSNSKLVLCVHGNRFGMTRCCDDFVDQEKPPDASSITMTGCCESGNVADLGNSADDQETRRSSDLHCHTDREGGIDKKARNKLIIASVLCLAFMILEIAGGIMANSLAIATDAAHLLTDFASFLISLFSIWMASKPASVRMNFGWHRAEVIGATVSVLLIWVVTGILVYMAVQRIISKEYEVDATIMLITSGIGVGVNIIMGCTLHQHGHGHSHGGGSGGHGHSHDHAAEEEGSHHDQHEDRNREQQHKENINVRAAFIHVLGDFLQSLGVFVAAMIIYFQPHLGIIDPICTFIFSVLVLVTTIRILKDTMNVLMEGIPRDISFNIVQETFRSVDGVVAVHNLRIWGLTTDKTALAAHLATAPGYNAQMILKEASSKIRARYNFYEMTLQVEEFEDEMDACNQCKPPIQ